MFDRFSDSARNLLILAREESAAFPRGEMDSGHLLLALIRDEDEYPSKILGQLGVTYQSAAAAVSTIAGMSDTSSDTVSEELTFLFGQAVTVSKALRSDAVETYHLLLAITVQDGSIAARALLEAGVDLDRLRQMALHYVGQALRGESSENRDAHPLAHHGQRRGRHGKSPISEFTVDLTERATQGNLDPLVGRDGEVERLLQVLCRRTKNNPVLIGDPGVGKTAIVEGLAQRVVAGDVPEVLLGAKLLSVDMGLLVAGTRHRGDFEERMKALMDAVENSSSTVVLFIDEIHTIVGAGAGQDSNVDAGNMVKPALARGSMRLIGATTVDEYRRHIESDAALERRFSPVDVPEPSPDDAVKMLRGLQNVYEEHHRVLYSDDAVVAAVTLSDRYISDRFLPDKAIDLLDEAGARARISRDLTVSDPTDSDDSNVVIDADTIADLVSSMTGVPVHALVGGEAEKLQTMNVALSSRVVGQPDAVDAVTRAVRRSRVGFGERGRPVGSFIFAGPTGVGKTEMAKALAEFLFGSEEALITVDMSEFGERHTMSRLFGSPPGYVGHDDGGQLTEKVRRRPYSVVLLDEVEKAHPEVFDAFLQVLDEGRLTDGQGRKVDFSNTVIIMTTNSGSDGIAKGMTLGFGDTSDSGHAAMLAQKVRANMKQHFRPEFLNRVDGVVVFNPLSMEYLAAIVDLQMLGIQERVAELDVTLSVTDAARSWIADAGWDPAMGARPLRRVIQSQVEDRLADMLLAGELARGGHVEIDARPDGLQFRLVEVKEELSV